MATKNPIELLIALGINDSSSRNNINKYIENIKKDLKLDVQINAPRGNSLGGIDKEIESLQKKITKLEQDLTKAMSIPNKFKSSEGMTDAFEKQKNSLSRLNTELVRAEKLFPRTMDKSKAEELRREIEKLSRLNVINPTSLKNNQIEIDRLRERIRLFSVESTQAAKSSKGIMDSFKIAMERFPIWMAASTAFYGTIQTAKEFANILIDIDSKLVSIQKVTTDGTDMGAIFDRATQSAEQFGQSISQALDAYIEFARQGYKGADLGILSDAGLVAANVGEITSQAASEYMTASLVQWKKDATEAMSIIDSWNNISNNFATTTEKLAQGQARSGATARAMGLEFDQLNAIIGTVTASTKQSGSEVGNFVKNVLPRLVGKPAQDALQSLNISLTDDSGNMRDVIEVYTEVANKVKNISDTERIAVVEGLAGKYHISRMQALIDDLGSADSMYRSMYETSKNSAGSAMKENEIYMQSLEARIALTRVEFEKLAVSVGNAFLTDGMIAFLQVASGGLGIISKLVDGIGILPIVLGTTGMATFALSTRFRTLSATVGTTIISLSGLKGSAVATTTATNLLTASTRGLSVAWKGFIASLGVGIPLVLVGIAVEKLVSKMGEARQRAEELESETKQVTDSYKSNKKSVDELIDRYSVLEDKMRNGDSSKSTLQEHAEVADKLGSMMPSLVQGEDTYGQKVIGSSDAIRVRVEMLQRQLDIQEKIAEAEAREKRDENIDTYKDSIDDSQKELDGYLSMLEQATTAESLFAKTNNVEKRIKFVDDKGEPVYKTFKDVENGIAKVNAAIKEANDNGDEDAVKYYTKIGNILKSVYEEASPLANSINKDVLSLRTAYMDSVNDIVSSNSELDDSVKESAKNLSSQLLNSVNESDLENVKNGLENIFSGVQFSDVSSELIKVFNDLENSSEESFGKTKKNTEEFLSTLPALLKSGGMSSKEISAVMSILEKKLNDVSDEHVRLVEESNRTGVSLEQLKANSAEYSSELDEAAESTENLASKMKDFKDITESLAGVSQAYVDDLDNLLLYYQGLTDQLAGYTEQQLQDIFVKENLNAEEQRVKDTLDKRLVIMNELASVYPDLLGKDGKAIALTSEKIEAIKAENKANKVLLEGYKNARDGKLTAEQQMTLAQASATKARIDNIKKELQALNILQTKMQEVYNEQVKKMKDEDPNSYTAGYGAYRSGTILGQTQSKISDYTSELDNLQSSLNSNIGTIDSFNTAIENSGKATKDSNNFQKDKNSTTKESIYITNQYREALEKLTYEIEKQQKLQAKYPEHSKEYRKHLEAQIKLEKDKLALHEKQAKALQSQIASGKIQQTGSISTNSSPTTNQNLSGWNGTISSGYGNRTLNGKNEFHRGIDIAMAKGTRLDANIGGKVVASGDAKKNGMSSTYGNVVVIQDTNGMKHIYAHLDKAIAKLGDTITAGMQIGTIGSTGTSTGNHLHYEINKNGNPIDPSNYLNDARNGKVSASYSSSSNQQTVVWNYFKNKGLNDKAIAGIMGNIQQESGFNSSAVNKSSGASGIFQWLGGRKNGLQDYAKSVGKSWSDLQVQLDYAWKELQGSEKKSLASLQRNDLSASQHASEFDRLFERSGGSAVGKRQDYANQYFNQFQGTNGGTGIGIDTSQQAIDQAKSDFYGVQNDALNTREIIEDLNEKLVKSNIAYYNHLSEGVDRSIKKSNILADQQLEHSQAYRDELEKETKHLEYKQSLLHKEANFIREQLKRTDLSPAFKDELTTQLSELSLSWWDVEESIKSVNEQIENSKIAEFDKKIETLNDSISKSNKLMDMYAKGSKEYNAEQKNIVTTLYEKQKAYESEAEALRKSIQLDKLSIREIERKKNRLKELSSTWLELQSEIVRINSDIADELINTMKDAYGQQRDYELALKDKQIEDLEELRDAKLNALDEESKAYEESIKEQMDALDKAHKDKLDKLDEESKAFEEAINRQLELMRKQRDEEDFNKDIGKLQKEEASIVAKINELSMDDSREAKLQRKKLEEELANIREQIADKQNDRQYELREQNLQDELDAYKSQQDVKKETEDNNYNTSKEALDNQLELYKKELEAKKKLEEEKFKATKAQLERERKDIVNHYDQLINNEQEYANLRAQIINGNVDGMSEKLSTFLGNFKDMNKGLINELDISWQELENKIYRITQAQGSLGNISTPNQNVDLNDGSIIGSGSNSNNSSSNTSARANAWQQYLANKKAWDSAAVAEKARLNKENEKLRNQYGFQDGSYDSLKNLKKYHSGGIVGGKGNRLTELTNKLFNTKPNEETVLALKRELFVPENNVSNMFTNIRAAMPNFKVNSPQGETIKIDNLLSIDSVSQSANLDIDRLLDQSLNKLIDKMRPYGFNIR